MHSLPLFMKLEGRKILLAGGGEGFVPKQRLLEAAGAKLVGSYEAGVRLAVLAIDDPDEAARAAAVLKERGVLVNVVDKPDLCDFSFPAIVDRSPVILAIGTGGASATLSKVLRERLEALLPAKLGKVADAVRAARAEVNARLRSGAERRRFWDRLMARGGTLDPTGKLPDDPGAAIRAALENRGDAAAGKAEIVLTSDDPDDLTLRQLRLLSQADLILYEAGISGAVLDRARRDAAVLPLGEGDLPGEGLTLTLRRAV
ncbi:hypothetical protein B5C34_01355 [Pacificimonas flava]|uniref:precorrin-2 dehydrogenase n=2 Tax=Pacificimonas TaxID=1960290 RepID=A0A219B328_9SPHN|nr:MULTISPECIES: bifunctional precorrin-2 dehydrogenase/sirohydrochlorin ferrochelatase [Pacificimonas]MBZ6378137.1 siroheme synthase [Pacificimonas aurantium]OWV32228.1 hypothetical protein B5C34_01355 [Pacificimonas flava]